MTKYVLLTREGDGARWVEHHGTVEASSAESAIRKAAVAGDWVAVPAASWRPLTVSLTTVERKTIAPAEPTKGPAELVREAAAKGES